MRDGDSFLLVFSLISKPTLISLGTVFKQLSRVKGDDSTPTPALVLGNKVKDLSYSVTGVVYFTIGLQSDLIDEREISAEEGQELASQYHCSYMETSALSRINIDEAFHEAARLAKAAQIHAREQAQMLKEQQKSQGKTGCCIIL